MLKVLTSDPEDGTEDGGTLPGPPIKPDPDGD